MKNFVRRARDFLLILCLVTLTTVVAYFIAAGSRPSNAPVRIVDDTPVLLLEQPLPFDLIDGADMRLGELADLPSPEDAYVDRADLAEHRVELRLRTARAASQVVAAYATWAEERGWFIRRNLSSQTGAEFVARRGEVELTVSAHQRRSPVAIRISVSHPSALDHWLPYPATAWQRGPLEGIDGPAGELINQTLHREVAEVWLRTPDSCSPSDLLERWEPGRPIRREDGALTSEAEWDDGARLIRMIVHRTSTACDVWIRAVRKIGSPPWGVDDD